MCPAGQVKRSCDAIHAACARVGLDCPAGYACLCDPCQAVPEREMVVSARHRVSDQHAAPLVYTRDAPCEKMAPCQVRHNNCNINGTE